jgi:uncharacterized protein (TIGR02001 family)
MRTSFGPILGLALALGATPAFAQEAEEADAITINGGASLVTDYRFRGITQTDKDFAVQGTFTVSHKSGFYATVWGSSIDDYVAFGSDQEIDIIGGFKKTFGGTTVDVGVLYYYYPGAEKFTPGINTDFAEPYLAVSHTFGPVTGKVTAAYAPKQSGLDYGLGKEDGFYLAGDLSGSFSGVGLSAHLGHSFSRNYITLGQKYTDWSVGASYTYEALTFGVQYVDTDASFVGSFTGKNIVKGGVVGTVSVAF